MSKTKSEGAIVRAPIFDGKASPLTVDSWLRLAASVVIQAVRDAQNGDAGAAEFLASDLGSIFCESIGLDFEAVRRKAEALRARARGKIVIRLEANHEDFGNR